MIITVWVQGGEGTIHGILEKETRRTMTIRCTGENGVSTVWTIKKRLISAEGRNG